MDAQSIADYLTMLEDGVGVAELKVYISDILSSLGDSGSVYVSVRNRPAAAIIGIKEYLDMTAKAEAFELLQLAEEAENAPKLSYEQIEERIMQNRTARAARSVVEAA